MASRPDLGTAGARVEDTADPARVQASPPGSTASRIGWPLGIVATVLLANLPAITGLVDTDPLGSLARATTSTRNGFLPGTYTIDQEAGWVSQALGHLVAQDWLHGIVPWWNPYEGLGMPLAAEMQAGAFFPLTPLLAMPHGQLVLHVVVQVIAGLGTYLLARELGCSRPAAAVAGALFAVNGTFALMGTAVALVVPFLPFTVLGVERIWRRAAGDFSGFVTLALSLALSFYAGFVETAYVDLLFAILWFAVRLVSRPAAGRLRFALKTAGGGLAGALLCAPLLVAFAEYLPQSLVGAHTGQFASAHVPAIGAATITVPWLYGPLLAWYPPGVGPLLSATWGNLGGFLTATAVCMAAFGLACRRADRALQVFLGVVTVLTLAFTFGFKPVQLGVDHLVPLAGDVWFARYVPPVWELGIALLASFGADWLLDGHCRRVVGRLEWWAFPAGVATTLLVVATGMALAWPALRQLYNEVPDSRRYAVIALSWSAVTVSSLTGLVALARRRDGSRRRTGRSRRHRAAAFGAMGVVVLDAVAAFIYPQLSAPRSAAVDTGPAQYLAAHLGNGRYFSLDVYLPNYGSYFQTASLDSNDSPVPKTWYAYVDQRLASNSEAYYFGTHATNPNRPSEVDQLVANLAKYEAVDVRYVLLTSTDPDPFGPAEKVVYRDDLATIYQLPSPTSFFSTPGAGCTLSPEGRDDVVAHCPAPARLVRAELEMQGWTAAVNGRTAPVGSAAGGLQSVDLPAGRSVVHFSYAPPRETVALALFVLGALLTSGVPLVVRVRRRRAPRGPHPPPGDVPGRDARVPGPGAGAGAGPTPSAPR